MDKKVVIVDMGDWSALFVDGKLVFQNHRVEAHDLEREGLLEIVYAEDAAVSAHLERHGLPKTLDETREMIESVSPGASQTA